MTNSKALWILVILVAIIVAFFIGNKLSEAEQRSREFDQTVREIEQIQEKMGQDLYHELGKNSN